MATRKLRSKTVDSADEDVHVEEDCADNSSHSQSETLRGQQRGNSVLTQTGRTLWFQATMRLKVI
jgi:hypothetical protein